MIIKKLLYFSFSGTKKNSTRTFKDGLVFLIKKYYGKTINEELLKKEK